MVVTLKNFFINSLSKYVCEHDDYSLKLKKISVLIVPFLIIPVSFLWSMIYFAYQQYTAASIPVIYTIISLITLYHYKKTQDIVFIQKAQMLLILILPFILMWSLGGFAQGSYVMIWSFFAPLGALIHDQNKVSMRWLLAFLTLVLFSVLIDPWLMQHHKDALPLSVIEIFFFLNIATALSGLFMLLWYFIHEKDKEANSILEAKNKELLQYTQELSNTVSYLQSYKNTIDANLIVTKTDIHGYITFANENFYKVSGFSKEEVIGKPHSIVRHYDNADTLYKKLWNTILEKQTWHGHMQNMRKDGSSYWIDTTIAPILNKDGEIVEFIAIRHDITKLIEQQKALTTMLYTDSLTNLKNRNALLEAIDVEKKLSLILINIDSFSQINDLYGEEFGNKVLIGFSKQLENSLSKKTNCQLFRLSGDEFVILSQETDASNLEANVIKLVDYMDKNPIIIDNQEISLNITVGISTESNTQLLPTANMALKIARRESKSLLIYNETLSLNLEYEKNLKWIEEIKSAIKEDRIVLYYQPIICNENGEINKYETLIRLIDKNGKTITPYHFLEIAKKAKLYKELTKIVINKSFDAFKNNNYDFSVNLTVEDILDPDINHYIIEKLSQSNIGTRVIFEIVESESIENFETIRTFIKKIKTYGAKIAIDDFGTGYSNFEHLMRLQADFIKIDGSIIKEIVHDKKSALITSIIVSFAKEMGIKTIGEYVENKDIHEKLIELGVNKSQGYYFDRPKAHL